MRTDDRVSCIVLLILSILICLGSMKYHIGSLNKPDAGTFPFVLGIVTASLSILILVKTKFEKGVAEEKQKLWSGAQGKTKVLYILLALVAYGLLLERLGYTLTIFILFLFLLKGHKWKFVIGWSLIASVGSYVLFHIALHVELAQGFLGI
jgi:hypothetical protein